MAVQAQFGGGLLAGCGSGGLADGALWDYGGGGSAAAQSELTCNGSGVALPLMKRGRDLLDATPSSAELLPIPGASRLVGSRMVSTSGRPSELSVADSLATTELMCPRQGGAEVDAVVRTPCDRLRAALEQAQKRHCQGLVRAAAGVAARRLRDKEVELDAAQRRAGELEERVRQAAAESLAWQGVVRSNEAVAAGLRATLEHLLLMRFSTGAVVVEGFGDSDRVAEADDAQSCCFGSKDAAAASKWACKSCGEREASVLLLPCRHLCLCKACEPWLDACPVCLAVKNASIYVAPN